ncbi:MAG TPA: hypothetical protein VMS78_11030 [Rhizomicrobium sp.]|nr:hypothetical protein [Rhizomicrobium sp.]
MVALDSAARAPSQIRFNLPALLIGGGLAGAIWAAAGPLAFLGFTYEGWSLANRATDEFAGLMFLVPFLAPAVATLFSGQRKTTRRDYRRLALGFVAAYAIHLSVAILAATIDGERLGAIGTANIAFQLLMLSSLVATSGVWFRDVTNHPLCRQFQNATLWFFWLAYTFAYIGHFDGPHIADASFGIGLMVLVVALLVRFSGALKSVWVRPMAEKVG